MTGERPNFHDKKKTLRGMNLAAFRVSKKC